MNAHLPDPDRLWPNGIAQLGVFKRLNLYPNFLYLYRGEWKIEVENFEPKFFTLYCDFKILNNMQCISALGILFGSNSVFQGKSN